MSDHISRKELKQDKIKETIEHGAEAVISHGQFTLIVVFVALVVALGYGGWRFYVDRQTVEASAAFDTAMKAYQGRIGSAPDPADPNEPVYADEPTRVQDALQKFTKVADKYPRTNPGKLARYYSALCLEDVERHNQALEELKKISGGSDKELASCRHPSQFQPKRGRRHLPANQERIPGHCSCRSSRSRSEYAFTEILIGSAHRNLRG